MRICLFLARGINPVTPMHVASLVTSLAISRFYRVQFDTFEFEHLGTPTQLDLGGRHRRAGGQGYRADPGSVSSVLACQMLCLCVRPVYSKSFFVHLYVMTRSTHGIRFMSPNFRISICALRFMSPIFLDLRFSFLCVARLNCCFCSVMPIRTVLLRSNLQFAIHDFPLCLLHS